jgi:hypothetical protein
MVKGNGHGRDPLELGAVQICRQGKKPGRKRGVFAPLPECAKCTQKSFLRHILGASAVAAEPVGQVDQWTLPALNNQLESVDVARQDSLYSGLIVARAQIVPPEVRQGKQPRGCICFLIVFDGAPQQKATKWSMSRSDLSKAESRIEEELMFTLPLALFLSAGAFALFSFVSVATWSDNRRREREAFYKSEALKKLAESPSADALAVLREQERIAAGRRHEGIRLGGLITTATALGVIAFFRLLVEDRPVWAMGLVPLFIGLAMLAYSYLLAPRE